MSIGQKYRIEQAKNEALMAETALMRAEHKVKMAVENATIAELRAELAEAREDSDRLDWLDLHISTQETSDFLGVDYSKCHMLRDAIDAARGIEGSK